MRRLPHECNSPILHALGRAVKLLLLAKSNKQVCTLLQFCTRIGAKKCNNIGLNKYNYVEYRFIIVQCLGTFLIGI